MAPEVADAVTAAERSAGRRRGAGQGMRQSQADRDAIEAHSVALAWDYLEQKGCTLRNAVNSWLADLFHPDNVDQKVAALLASQDGVPGEWDGGEAARKRLADAEARIRKFQAAIAAGVDPSALVEVINTAQAERAAAHAEINNTPAPELMDAAEVYARIDMLGDVPAKLTAGAAEGTRRGVRGHESAGGV